MKESLTDAFGLKSHIYFSRKIASRKKADNKSEKFGAKMYFFETTNNSVLSLKSKSHYMQRFQILE